MVPSPKPHLNGLGDFGLVGTNTLAFTLTRLAIDIRSQLHIPLRHSHVEDIFLSKPSLHLPMPSPLEGCSSSLLNK